MKDREKQALGVKVDPRPLAAGVETPARDGDNAPTIDVASTPPLELGDAFHRVMERVALPGGEDVEELAAAICAEAAVELVVEMVRRCLSSEVVQRAIASGDVHREIPFVVEEDGEVLIGRMDLVFRDGDRAVVVDYKTDSVVAGRETAAAEVHRGQAGVYRRAVSRTLGAETDVSLLFARTGSTVEV